MRIAPRVHLVASGSGGVGLTDPFDCNAYLIDGVDEAALIDAGIGTDAETIVGNAEAAGISRDKISRLLLTHAHPDHSGGAAEMRRLLPGLSVGASPSVATWVETADAEAMSVAMGKRAGFYPSSLSLQPCPVEDRLRDGDRVKIGGTEIAVLETPGHADGHLSFYTRIDGRKCLFCGDVVFYGGYISLVNNWDCRLREYDRTITRLAKLEVDLLLPGHQSITLSDGRRHIDKAHTQFQRGFIPQSIV